MTSSGYTLVEVMIVVVIIGIIAAIGIPNLLRAKVSANEGAMKDDLRMFSSSAESYRAATAPHVYPSSIADMTGATPSYLDSSWNSSHLLPGRHGYLISYTQRQSGRGFTVLASPISGQAENYFCVDQTGTILGNRSSVTASTDGCSAGAPIA